MKAEEFLSPAGKRAVTDAIKEAELGTSGEIRIHIDDICKTDPMQKAKSVFRLLEMDKTAMHNGVLIYVACKSRVFAIVGDSGINEAVPEGFWNDVTEMMGREFSSGRFAEGLEEAVRMAGEKLKEYFPYQEGDINELPDEISFGKKQPE